MRSAVFNINALEPEFSAKFDPLKPWVFEADQPDGNYVQECYSTEIEACARQLRWRAENPKNDDQGEEGAAMKYEVQHFTLADGWVNTWIDEWDGEGVPIRYDTREEAQEALDEYLADIAAEIKFGHREPDEGYSRSEFRVAEVQP